MLLGSSNLIRISPPIMLCMLKRLDKVSDQIMVVCKSPSYETKLSIKSNCRFRQDTQCAKSTCSAISTHNISPIHFTHFMNMNRTFVSLFEERPEFRSRYYQCGHRLIMVGWETNTVIFFCLQTAVRLPVSCAGTSICGFG